MSQQSQTQDGTEVKTHFHPFSPFLTRQKDWTKPKNILPTTTNTQSANTVIKNNFKSEQKINSSFGDQEDDNLSQLNPTSIPKSYLASHHDMSISHRIKRCPSPKMTPLNRERRRLCNIFKTAESTDQLKVTTNDSRVKRTTLVFALRWSESPKFPESKDSSNGHILEKYSTQINVLCCLLVAV